MIKLRHFLFASSRHCKLNPMKQLWNMVLSSNFNTLGDKGRHKNEIHEQEHIICAYGKIYTATYMYECSVHLQNKLQVAISVSCVGCLNPLNSDYSKALKRRRLLVDLL